MIKIKVSTIFPEWPFIRQTPGSKGIWGNCQYFIDTDIKECDYWIVYGGLTKEEKTLCPIENTILISGEPPTFRKYNPDFLEQFATIISSDRTMSHPNVINSQQGLPWHVGREEIGGENISFTKDYDELKAIKSFKKDKLISCVVSDKKFTEGHKKRFYFVKKLEESSGLQIDVFGRGIRDIPDKWDAICRYKYHLVIENSSVEDYWTEKLSDAFLAGAYPFYYGCQNISDYFSKDSFSNIDIDDFEKTVSIIKKAIDNEQYEKSIDQIDHSRKLILDKYNFFAMISDFCSNKEIKNNSKVEMSIKPENKTVIKPLRSLTKRFSQFINKYILWWQD